MHDRLPVSTVDNMTVENNGLPGTIYFDAHVSYKATKVAEVYLPIGTSPARTRGRSAVGPATLR